MNGTEFITEPLIKDCLHLLNAPWHEEELKQGIQEVLDYLQWVQGLSKEEAGTQQMLHCAAKEVD